MKQPKIPNIFPLNRFSLLLIFLFSLLFQSCNLELKRSIFEPLTVFNLVKCSLPGNTCNPAAASTPTFTIAGSITGLGANTGLVLSSGGSSPQSLTISANATTFQFANPFPTGYSYSISVTSSPSSLACVVSANGSGAITANVTNVAITCTLNTFTIDFTLDGVSLASVSTGPFDFVGAVSPGNNVPKRSPVFQMTNTGTGTITIASNLTNTTDFSLSTSLPTTLSPSSSISFRLIYSPATLGSKTGVFTVNTNATTIPNYTVNLTCEGVDLSTGIYAWYKLDGNLQDASGNGNHGVNATAPFTPTVTGPPTFATDRNGTANSAGNFVAVQGFASQFIASCDANFTITGWVKVANVNVQTPFMGVQDSPGAYPGFTLRATPGNGLEAIAWLLADGFNTRGIAGTVSTGTITANTWYFFAYVQNSVTRQGTVYLNGSSVTTTPFNPGGWTCTAVGNDIWNPGPAGNRIIIGYGYFDTNFTGGLDDIRFYNRQLSASELSALRF